MLLGEYYKMNEYIKLIRIKHWIKNFFIFAPLIFAKAFFDKNSIIISFAAFASFSLVASFVYIINDIHDKDSDKIHPKKCKRPIASGAISSKIAMIYSLFILAIGIGIGSIITQNAFLVIITYLLLNIGYSFKLKDILFLDIIIIAIGFVLRVIVGALAIGVELSNWILVTTFFISMFLGFCKRRYELLILIENPENFRPVLKKYPQNILDQMIGISTTLTIISYSLYAISEETITKLETNKLIYTIPFVVYGVSRYIYLTYQKEKGGDPADVIIKDYPIIINFLLWLGLVLILLLGKW